MSYLNNATKSPLLQNAELTWKQDDTPVSKQFDDVYFAQGLGIEESQYVFLQGNQLYQRWQNLATEENFTIVETGFGTGLNFLSAAQLWRQKLFNKKNTNKKAHLHYIAVEQFPISCKNMALILQRLLKGSGLVIEVSDIIHTLINHYPPAVSGYHRILISDDITLTLLFGSAEETLNNLQTTTSPALSYSHNMKVDAWFLDGFSPAKNPTMWTSTLFTLMANLSNSQTTFATFTAATAVNKGLTTAGFTVKKIKGFGTKRNMLLGTFNQKPESLCATNKYGPQWFVTNTFLSPVNKPTHTKKVAVIGGGLAGCHSAYQLARRGFLVDIFDKNKTLASEASGNTQGVLFHRLSHQNDSLSRFSLTAWLYGIRLYQQFFSQGLLQKNDGDFNGSLQLNEQDNTTRYSKLKQLYQEAQWLQFLSPQQASQKSGIEISSPAIEFTNGGWVSPPAVCRALTQNSNITFKASYEVINLTQTPNKLWQLQTKNSDTFYDYYAVVIANSHSANALPQTTDLPLQCVKGQISSVTIPSTNHTALPQCTLCHAGYITPAINSTLSFGASFILNDKNTALNTKEHQDNIQQQLHYLPSLSPLLTPALDTVNGRTGVRCTTPDYLPIVGPVADTTALKKSYQHISHNAKANCDIPGQWFDGLYVLTGLGSRGLTYGALAADIIACHINSEPMPCDRLLLKALSPARFTIKNIVRNQSITAK